MFIFILALPGELITLPYGAMVSTGETVNVHMGIMGTQKLKHGHLPDQAFCDCIRHLNFPRTQHRSDDLDIAFRDVIFLWYIEEGKLQVHSSV